MELLIVLAALAPDMRPKDVQPLPTAERTARCTALANEIGTQTVPPDDPRSREINVCRAAMRAGDALIFTAYRTTQQVEEPHVRTGVHAARQIVEAFNRDGAAARFDEADRTFVDAYVVALQAEACLLSTLRADERTASRRAVLAFNRSGAATRYAAATRRMVHACRSEPRQQRKPARIEARGLGPVVPTPGRLAFQGARFQLPAECNFVCRGEAKVAPAGRKVSRRSATSDEGVVGGVECSDLGPRVSLHYSAGPRMSRSFEHYDPGTQGTKPLDGGLFYWGVNAAKEVYCVIVTYPLGPDKVITHHQFCTPTSQPESVRQRLRAIADTFERVPLSNPIEPAACLMGF